VVHNDHHLLVTTRAFLELMGFRDLADLPPLSVDDPEENGDNIVGVISASASTRSGLRDDVPSSGA